jgi:hypothetical protein
MQLSKGIKVKLLTDPTELGTVVRLDTNDFVWVVWNSYCSHPVLHSSDELEENSIEEG